MGADQSAARAADTEPATVRPWQLKELLPDFTSRLSKSTTIALLLSPVGIILLAVIRLLIVCNYNVTTALAVASSGGYVNTLFGTVLPMVPILLPYLAFVLLFSGRVLLGYLAAIATLLISPAEVSNAVYVTELHRALSALSSSAWFIPILIAAGISSLLLWALLMSNGWNVFSRSLSVIAGILLVPALFLLYPLPSSHNYYEFLVRQPWLPSENVTLRSGAVVTGYVLSDDQNWTTILTDSGRRIFYYRPAEIVSRHICRARDARARLPVISLITTRSQQLPWCNLC